jgi:MscS family membrane protein
MFLWNIVNLIDAEASWFLTLCIVILIAFIASEVLVHLFRRLAARFQEANLLWQASFIKALFRPMIVLLWFLIALFGIDLVTDHILKEQYSYLLHLLLSISWVLSISWFFLRWKNELVRTLISIKPASEKGKIIGFGKLFSAFVIVLTVLVLLEQAGGSVATLVAFSSIGGLALAIASQEMIANFFGGGMIFITHPFVVGHQISIPAHSIEGVVEDIGWYQTRILGLDRKPIIVPNALFIKAQVINTSRRTRRKLEVKISLRHQDLAIAPAIADDIKKFLAKHEAIDSKENTLVSISSIGPYSVDLLIEAISFAVLDVDFYTLQSALLLQVGEIIRHHGGRLAIPIQGIEQSSFTKGS